jgi:2-dehydropantoate 2-reductase
MAGERLLVIGAGVNGSILATNLFRAGKDVTVLARGHRLQALQTEGIVIENPFSGKRVITRLPVIGELAPGDRYDFIFVAVRKNQAIDLLPVLAKNCSPNIVFLGNNLLGPAEFIQALGAERVMMGSVYGAGRREGDLIRAISFKRVSAPFGEVDGSISPRLKQLRDVLREAGFGVELSRNIVDFQSTHGVGVAIIGALTMKHHGSARELARSKDDLRLFAEGRREGFRVLRSLGKEILPASERFMTSLPSFLQVWGMQLLLHTKMGVVGMEWHVSQAPDEMIQLGKELLELCDQVNFPVPVIRKALENIKG